MWVDVNVCAHLYELNFLGVPKTWKHYATRYLKSHLGLEYIERDLEAIKRHTGGDDFTLLVYGGEFSVFENAPKQIFHVLEHNNVMRSKRNG